MAGWPGDGARRAGLLLAALVCLGRILAADRIPLATSQGGRIFTQQWTVDQGLPDNHVEEVQLGPDGALWIGTRGGLVRLLGDRLEAVPLVEPGVRHLKLKFDPRGIGWISTRQGMVWTRDPEHLAGAWRTRLQGRPVGHAMTRDGKGVLWLVLGSELYQADSPEPVGVGNPPPGLEQTAWGMVGARQGGVLVAATNGAIWHGSQRGWEMRAPPPPQLAGLAWYQLGEDPRGRLWLSWVSGPGAQGVAFHAGQGWVPMPSPMLTQAGLPQQFTGGSEGEWLAPTANGYVLRLGEDWPDTEYLPVAPGEALNVVVADSLGNWWIGATRSGLRRCSRSLASLYSQAPPVRVRSLTVSTSGTIVVGSQGAGLMVASSTGLRPPTAADGLPILPETYVDAFLRTPQGLWVGTPDHLELWEEGKPVPKASWQAPAIRGSLFALVTNAAGSLFVGSTHGRVWKVDDPAAGSRPELLGETVGAAVAGLAMVRETLWAATEGGLRTWNGRSWEVPPGGNAGGGARCVRVTRDGWVVAGTDRGLWLQAGTNWFLWPANPGKPLPPVNQMVEDLAGQLWLGTARGLCRIGRDDLRRLANGQAGEVLWSLQTKADGLPAHVFTYAGTALLLPDGRLAFSTQDGLLVMRPGAGRPRPPLPRVQITGVELDGVWFPVNAGSPRIQPRQRPATAKVRFEFVAVESPNEAGFRHRFADLAPAWTTGGSEREVILNRPSPGAHRFEVECHAGDGVWHPAAGFVLEFMPYWWETTFAKWSGGLLLVFLPLGIQGFIHRRRRLRRQQAQALSEALQAERERIARELHDHIGNRLSGIQAVAERLSRESPGSAPAPLLGRLRQSSIEAVIMLEEAVRTLGSPGGSSGDELIATLREETAGYAEAVGLRHEFQASAAGPARLPDATRQAFLSALRELLRNAHRHGAAENVRVRFMSQADRLRLVVEDDGRGFEVGDALQMKRGLAGLAARVTAAGGRLEIRSSPGATRAEVMIPGPR